MATETAYSGRPVSPLTPCSAQTHLQGVDRMTDALEPLSAVTGKVLRYQPRLQERKEEATSSPMLRKPRLLDLFCCAGGSGVGYSQAGFEVIGVDVQLQGTIRFHSFRRMPYTRSEIHRAVRRRSRIPPMPAYSDLAKRNGNADEWPRLIEPVRDMLVQSGLPYVIENVDGAPLHNTVVLCRTIFPTSYAPQSVV